MKIEKIASLVLALVLIGTLLSACGGSEADKAYDEWATTHLKAVEKATETLDQAFSEDNDPEDNLDILDAYLDVIEPALEAFEVIDESGLTGKRKDVYPDQLASLQSTHEKIWNRREEIYYELEG